MPFNSSGVYTAPAGATTAAPGQVIRSTTWNSIFTDISTALTQLGQQSWVAAPRVISVAGNITIAAADAVVLIQATVGTITMPACATKQGPVRIFGAASGFFGTAGSVILFNGTEKADGLGTITLGNDYQSIGLQPLSSGGYVVF